MSRKLFSYEIAEIANKFLKCETIDDIRKLGLDIYQIQVMGLNPPYYTFEARKSHGGVRIIEAPEENLKELQRQLNFYLQCIYYTVQTPNSHGYIISAKDSTIKKNILSNAKSHIECKYMLNVDFKDFFHQITSAKVLKIFRNYPFHFDTKTATILVRIVTYKKRLPMGAPTSPALSNFAAMQLDIDLDHWAKSKNIIYTRFVDDLTFSSEDFNITLKELEEIKAICSSQQFELNTKKTKFMNEDDVKSITGLILNETIDIDPVFYDELNDDINRLRKMAEVNIIMNKHNHDSLLRDFKKEIEGKINFIGMIEGFDSNIFYKYRKRLKIALNPDEDILFSRWTNFNYF